jgi:hypothetical protein
VVEIFVPITLFITMTVTFCMFFWFRYRARVDLQQTLRAAIEKGHEVTPELVASLGSSAQRSRHRDLRLAIIWIAIAAGLTLFGAGMSPIEEEVFSVMLAISAFPLMMGLAYLIMWRFAGDEQ